MGLREQDPSKSEEKLSSTRHGEDHRSRTRHVRIEDDVSPRPSDSRRHKDASKADLTSNRSTGKLSSHGQTHSHKSASQLDASKRITSASIESLLSLQHMHMPSKYAAEVGVSPNGSEVGLHGLKDRHHAHSRSHGHLHTVDDENLHSMSPDSDDDALYIAPSRKHRRKDSGQLSSHTKQTSSHTHDGPPDVTYKPRKSIDAEDASSHSRHSHSHHRRHSRDHDYDSRSSHHHHRHHSSPSDNGSHTSPSHSHSRHSSHSHSRNSSHSHSRHSSQLRLVPSELQFTPAMQPVSSTHVQVPTILTTPASASYSNLPAVARQAEAPTPLYAGPYTYAAMPHATPRVVVPPVRSQTLPVPAMYEPYMTDGEPRVHRRHGAHAEDEEHFRHHTERSPGKSTPEQGKEKPKKINLWKDSIPWGLMAVEKFAGML